MRHTHYHADISSQPDDDLLDRLAAGYGDPERQQIAAALELARKAQEEDTLTRPRGIDVAHILHQLRVDATTIQVALLSDPYIRDSIDAQLIERRFGAKTAELVQKVNWLNTFDEYHKAETKEPDQAELLRSMLLAVVNDVRAVLVKLAYRLQRLRLLKDHPDPVLRRNIALETLDLLTPLANRLGVGQLKWEMEDLSFRYLEPEEYKRLAKSLASNRAARESFVQHFIHDLREKLETAGVTARVFGRPKHIYSIHKKIERKDIPLEELYDLHAVRVIVRDASTCYTVLGLVHSAWLHIPKEFYDYIANPKANGYQSLHTVVIGPEGRPVEIQIRTEDMHSFAEFGVAAHWRYKEGSKQDQALDRNVNTLRQLLESRDDEQGILDSFRSEVFEDQIFVLTPKGQVIRLRKGATPVDFAYGIHTEVGHRCRGAKINGRMTSLTHALKSGDKVEILTAKHGGPSLGWVDPHLGYVKTAHARNKIRAWFRQQDHERHMKAGKHLFDQERQKLGVREADLEQLARHFHLPRADDLLLALGRTDISAVQLAAALKPGDLNQKAAARPVPSPRKPVVAPASDEITIQGVRNLVTHIARCCEPKPGEPIIGFVTVVRGIAIHRQDCPNILQLAPEKHGRLMDVTWGAEPEGFSVDIEARALDRKGLLKDITHILAAEHINILRTHSYTDTQDNTVVMEITAEVMDLGQLSQALGQIAEVHNVLEVWRKEPGQMH
ncbi:MAG: bifunctional (p)ppGpp synthetase/guanosine-3',5'-bis(diphosphate) 3'-pyrophosphohydrolase [Methylococcaceae bacterium]|nr:bifunctional (p)ppGpp synthetase/guanosine-3',5'-bis(diphosphate) 3'-pyrophosphohydrolase [Methylococcaceae bacterium]